MELKGESVSSFIHKTQGSLPHAKILNLLINMLQSIENTHAAGVLHRDIKPANFVMGLNGETDSDKTYLVDFGLAKEHISETGEVYPPRTVAEFRGTIPYASLASHFKKELGRKDDLWSFFFIMLEFLE